MKIELKENERIDDLGCNGLKLIQNTKGFCFGLDSVLLSDFAKEIKKDSKVVDLGTGTGIIPILLCGKTKVAKVIGVEIQEDVCEMAKRSISLNGLEERFEVIHKNIKELEGILEKGSFDAVVSNPPYKKIDTGIQNENKKKQISRHEITANLEEFIQVAYQLLKEKGNFYLIHRPERLVDILELLRKYRLEPKKIKMVQPYVTQKPNLVLIKATKYAQSFLTVEKPLYVYEQDGTYTKELLQIYNKEK